MFSYHTGQPVAWCIANSETSEVVEIFLSSMKAKSPMTPVRVLMTDDGELNRYCLYKKTTDLSLIDLAHADNTGWSAAQAVYGEGLKHLLCLWHVDRYGYRE